MNKEVHNARLISITPDAEKQIVYMARVSNPSNQENMNTAPRLIRYLLKHKHVSPFEMATMQVEINTTRAIAAQVLRHRSFSFQEFSQRYSDVSELPALGLPHLLVGKPQQVRISLPLKHDFGQSIRPIIKSKYKV